MAYLAVTSLMGTLDQHFLQSQPRLALEDLEAQMRDGNENLGLLQQILEDMAMESSKGWRKKKLIKNEKQLAESSSQNERVANARDTILLISRLKEVAEVKQNIVSLHENLSFLQQSLEKSEMGYDNEGAMKDLEAKMRDVLFKAEERIEMELITIYLAKDNSLHITACLLRLHEIFNEAQKQTDYLKNELIRIQSSSEYQLAKAKALLQNEAEKQTEYQLAKASLQNERISDDVSLLVKGSSLPAPDHLVHKNIMVSKVFKNSSKFDTRMVGCHEVFKKISDQLTQQSTKRRQVVSIVGMGGIGKTTLAHKVYEDSSITSHFDKRAWVIVSQEYNLEQMLRCLIACVTAASRDELDERSTAQDRLAERLHKCLKGQRYFIVIDDIWNTTAWDSMQRCFPDDNNGSRILLTSRLREVAEYASSGNSPLNMPFLDVDESWSLYCKVFGKIEFPSEFEQIGRNIVKKCKGLPLAITVVASLLSKTEEDKEKWENVAKSLSDDSNDACSRILYLSYNQLPHQLKACFLYFGIFEEDYEIPVKKLVRLWAAEGFFSTVKHVNTEEAGMECLQDLVDRSLVIVSKQSYNEEMKRIMIHDLLRDLCLREARSENLLNIIGLKKRCRWISHSSRSFCTEVRFEDEYFHKSHSIHYTDHYYHWFTDVESLFSHLKLLRVVDIRGRFCDGEKTLKVLANLVHLRYLAFFPYNDFEIKLFEHWNMQSFIVSGYSVILDPSEAYRIWKMPLLRNFCIGHIFSLNAPPVVYRNLENISWLDSKLCTKDLFTMIPNLKKLGVDGGFTNPDWLYNCVHLGQLGTLSIKGWGYVKRIPWATSFLPNLKKLSFLDSYMQWSDMSLISMLPKLEVLKLINACKGLKWELSDEGFCGLKRLVIEGTSLKYWIVAGDYFPMLECLEISDCLLLEEIPRGFADITTLALIQLNKCKDSVLASAKWIQDEQSNNYGNDALLVRSENIRLKNYGKRFEEGESDE